jgi:hypothetical protein
MDVPVHPVIRSPGVGHAEENAVQLSWYTFVYDVQPFSKVRSS